MDIEVIEIGSFSVYTNTDQVWNGIYDPTIKDAVSKAIETHLNKRLIELGLDETIYVLDIKSKIGCIITEIALGVLAGFYVFVKDYDKLRGNIPVILDDFKNGYMQLSKKLTDQGSKTSAEFSTQIPENLKDHFDKKIGTGQVINEFIKIVIVHTALMRDDLKRQFNEYKMKKRTIEGNRSKYDINNNEPDE